jgi:hypothetical protein
MTMTMKPRLLGQIAAPSASETIAVGEDGTNEHGCLACPFCGNTDIQPQRVQITPRCRPDSAVICRHCDAVGPWANTPQLAVKIWNEGFTLRRPASYRAKQKLARISGRAGPRKRRKK